MMKVTDEMLMALADGELDRETAVRVRLAVEADPDLGRRLAEFERTRRIAKEAFAGVLEEAVPGRLIAATGSGRLFSAAGRPRRAWLPVGAAIAASIAGFAVAMFTLPRPAPTLLPEGQEIARLMETAATGETQPWPRDGHGSLEVTGSYPVRDGVCRTFLARSDEDGSHAWQGIACRHDGTWSIDIAVAGAMADQFSPASDQATQSIDAFLDAAGAGEKLDAAAEQRLRQNGWHGPGGGE